MAGRHSGWAKKSGDAAASPGLQSLGRKLLGYLDNQQALGAPDTMVIRRSTPEGSVVASIKGGIPQYATYPTSGGGALEEVVFLYASSTTKGLCVFDLGLKKLFRNFTGLEQYQLRDVDAAGRFAYMTYSTSLARVDMKDVSATGRGYPAQTAPSDASDEPTIPGVAAMLGSAWLSPNGKRAVVHFAGTGEESGGSVVLREGVGGLQVVDAETLDPVRGPIRMTYRPAVVAWDGNERFFATTSSSVDIGDFSNTAQYAGVSEGPVEYVSKFTADGVLVGSVPVGSWNYPSGGGFFRVAQSLVVIGDRAYVLLRKLTFPGLALTVAIIDTDALAVVDEIDVAGAMDDAAYLAACGNRLFLVGDNGGAATAAELDVENGLSVLYTTTSGELATFYAPTSGAGPWANPPIKRGPDSRIGQQPDRRMFLINADTDVVRGYRTFEAANGQPHDVYEYDLSEHGVTPLVCFASVGTRPQRTAA